MKKQIFTVAMATSLACVPLLNNCLDDNYVLATNLSESSSIGLSDRGTLVPVIPAKSVIGQETAINLNVNLTNPAKINVMRILANIEGDAEFVSIGDNPRYYNIKPDGSLIYINDALEDYKTIPLVLKVNGSGPVKVNLTVEYADAEKESSNSTSVNLNVVADDRSLEVAKEEAKVIINDLSNLSDDEKTNYTQQVDNSKTVEEVNSIVLDAQNKDRDNAKAKLEAAKEKAKEQINNLPNISDSEKEEYNIAIDLAGNEEAINKIVHEAETANGLNENKDPNENKNPNENKDPNANKDPNENKNPNENKDPKENEDSNTSELKIKNKDTDKNKEISNLTRQNNKQVDNTKNLPVTGENLSNKGILSMLGTGIIVLASWFGFKKYK